MAPRTVVEDAARWMRPAAVHEPAEFDEQEDDEECSSSSTRLEKDTQLTLQERQISVQLSEASIQRSNTKLTEFSGLPSISRRSRSCFSLASSVPSVLAPMPGKRPAGAVLEPQGLLENHYKITKALGKGSYGEVFRVRHRSSGELRALKTIPLNKLEDPGAFKTELDVARQLEHPYIVQLHEVFQTGDCVHLVMELCSGGTLAGMMTSAHASAEAAAGKGARARFPDDLIGRFMWQMLSGVAYLHHHRIVHRDIKPENYLIQVLQKELFLKLADFGLACSFKRGRPVRDVLGTPCFVAPEVLTGSYDERCDIWSIGVVCHVLCTGYHPFSATKGDTAKAVLTRIKKGQTEELPESAWSMCSAEARQHVSNLMTRDPEFRPRAKQLCATSTWLQRHDQPLRKLESGGNSCCVVS